MFSLLEARLLPPGPAHPTLTHPLTAAQEGGGQVNESISINCLIFQQIREATMAGLLPQISPGCASLIVARGDDVCSA